ncbi:Ras-related protein Rab-31 [Tritrichomonas foetus]|uniref:Ras-related protein Rab-31 n=1 Tax=Tritrichomonas foetus TaxID=1144522 RepID=A0A1J4KEZ0_9EUKA|nr:Ras-related protein Rab-31 [Tritrichomonas foetus]|eukprot:OHT07949.1 Ras-related protein Rab-31 [Tritrichomonas foetus]
MHTMDQIEAKVVMLGTSNVGKTTIINRTLNGIYDHNINPTLGANYSTKNITVYKDEVRLQIWDTAGEEKYRSLVPMFFQGSHAAIFVYSINDRKSFEELDYFIKCICEHSKSSLVKLVVGNKVDLENQRQVQTFEAKQFAHDIEAQFIEVSALTGSCIEKLFYEVAKSIYDVYNQGEKFEDSISIEKSIDSPNYCC